MSIIAGAQRERLIKLDTAVVGAAPNRQTKPHFTVSPRTAQGLPTQGIGLTLIEPAADAAVGIGADESSGTGGGFNVTMWRAVPVTGGWAELAPFTALANYGEQYVLGDISGSWGIYFQITGATADGLILLGIAEMD